MCLDSRISEGTIVSDPQSVYEFARRHRLPRKQEPFLALLLDAKNRTE